MNKFHLFVLASLLASPVCHAFTFDNDVSKNIQTQITDDLKFIGTVESDTQSELHKQIFGELSGSTYSKFFTSRVTEVGMSTCGSQNAVACVMPFFNSSK